MIDEADLIIRHHSLSEIDGEIKLWEGLQGDYAQAMLQMLRHARDLAEFCLMNDIPTNAWKPTEDKTDYRLPQILATIMELDNKLTYTLRRLNSHILSGKKDKYTHYEE